MSTTRSRRSTRRRRAISPTAGTRGAFDDRASPNIDERQRARAPSLAAPRAVLVSLSLLGGLAARQRRRTRAEPGAALIGGVKPDRGEAAVRRKAPASALARLEALMRLVDDVDAALAAHQAIVAMTPAQRLQGIADFHGITQERRLRARPTAEVRARSYAPFRRADQAPSADALAESVRRDAPRCLRVDAAERARPAGAPARRRQVQVEGFVLDQCVSPAYPIVMERFIRRGAGTLVNYRELPSLPMDWSVEGAGLPARGPSQEE